jgi:mannitol-1-phosphate/altronate dehydrogenase
MTADSSLNIVVLGAGALGLGFIGPELTPRCRITYLDIPAKADLLSRLRQDGAYTFNQTGLSMRAVRVEGVSGLAMDDAAAADALDAADIVITAVGEPNLPKVAPTLAEVALRRKAGRPLRILCAENGVDIAHGLRTAVETAARRELGAALLVGDTVMGRMCKIVTEPAPPVEPVAPGLGWAVVAEPYFGIPVEAHAVAGLDGLPPAVRPQGSAAFGASEDVKMLSHNGLHAVISCLGFLRGRQYFDELRTDADIMELARRLLAEEAAPALLKKHAGALDRNEHLNYSDWILRRVTCPVLHDPIERGVRGTMRKLQPWERLVHSVRTVSEQGIEPAAFATGLAAAVEVARRTGETRMGFGEVLAEWCKFDREKDEGLLRLTRQCHKSI